MKTKNKIFTFLVGILCLIQTSFADSASSTDFQLEFWSEASSVGAASSDDFQFEGGSVDMVLNASSEDIQLTIAYAYPFCGDGIIASGESCDSSELGGASCTSQGFTGGTLSCTSSCTFDTSACTTSTTSTGSTGGGGGGRGSVIDEIPTETETKTETEEEDTVEADLPSDEESAVEEPAPVFPDTTVVLGPVSTEDAVDEEMHEAAPIPAQLFDITFALEDSIIEQASELSSFVTLESFGTEPTPIDLTFIVLDAEDQEVYREVYHLVVRTEEFLRWDYEKLADLPAGKYVAILHTVYSDGVYDEFRANFEIVEEESYCQVLADHCYLVVITLLALLALLWIWVRRRKPTAWAACVKKIKTALSRIFVLIIVLLNVSAVDLVEADTPDIFFYVGRLLDSSGSPITTAHDFRFSFWSSADKVDGDIDSSTGAINTSATNYGGWYETLTITPNANGVISVNMGQIDTIPTIDFTRHKYLQIEVKSKGTADTAYQLLDPTGDAGADTTDRLTIGSVAYSEHSQTGADNFIINPSGTDATLQFGQNLNGLISYTEATDIFSFGGARLTNLADPVNSQDAATKNYVDNTGWQEPIEHRNQLVSGVSGGIRAGGKIFVSDESQVNAGDTITVTYNSDANSFVLTASDSPNASACQFQSGTAASSNTELATSILAAIDDTTCQTVDTDVADFSGQSVRTDNSIYLIHDNVGSSGNGTLTFSGNGFNSIDPQDGIAYADLSSSETHLARQDEVIFTWDADGSTWIQLTSTASSGTGVYIGATSTTYAGNITSGSYVSYQAANDLCNSSYSGSHICSTDEILATIANQSFSSYTGNVWISEGPPGYTASANDCDGWTTNSSDSLGPYWNWDANAGGGKGFLTPCTSSLGIACCR